MVGTSAKKPFEVVFKSSGSRPLDRCCAKGAVTRVYDRSAKGYVLTLSGGRSTSVLLPKKKNASLGLTPSRPFLVMQIFVPRGRPFTTEIIISDDKLTRRRLVFSTAFKEELYGELHAQIPLHGLERGKWTNLVVDMLSITNECFEDDTGGSSFRVCDNITVHSVCKLRNIFTVRTNPHGLAGIPTPLAFASGVNCLYWLYNASVLESHRPIEPSLDMAYIAENNDLRFDEKVPTSARRPRVGRSPAQQPDRRQYPGHHGTPTSVRSNPNRTPMKKIMPSPSLAFGTRYTPEPRQRHAAPTPGGSTTPPRPVKSAWKQVPSPLRAMKIMPNNFQEKYMNKVPAPMLRKPKNTRTSGTSPSLPRVAYPVTSPSMTPTTPHLTPAPKRTPMSQALEVVATPPGSPQKAQTLEESFESGCRLGGQQDENDIEYFGATSAVAFHPEEKAQGAMSESEGFSDDGGDPRLENDQPFVDGTSLRSLRQHVSLYEEDDNITMANTDSRENREEDEAALFVRQSSEQLSQNLDESALSFEGEAVPQNDMAVEDLESIKQYDSGDSMYDDDDELVLSTIVGNDELDMPLANIERHEGVLDDVDVELGSVDHEEVDSQQDAVPENDELVAKQLLLDEKRRKLMELEEAYLEEFGDEEEALQGEADAADDNEVDVEDGDDVEAAEHVPCETEKKDHSVELIYDSVLACYFDPSTGRYYEIQQ